MLTHVDSRRDQRIVTKGNYTSVHTPDVPLSSPHMGIAYGLVEFKNEKILVGEKVVLFDQVESGLLNFFDHIASCDFHPRRRYRQRPIVEVNDDEPPSLPQRPGNKRVVAVAILNVMNRITEEDHIDRRAGELRVIGSRPDKLDVSEVFVSCAPPEVVEHIEVDIHRVDLSRLPHGAGEAHDEVARAGPDLGHPLSALELQPLDHLIGLLPFLREGDSRFRM